MQTSEDVPATTGEKVPAGHSEHVTLPCCENVPGGQAWHSNTFSDRDFV